MTQLDVVEKTTCQSKYAETPFDIKFCRVYLVLYIVGSIILFKVLENTFGSTKYLMAFAFAWVIGEIINRPALRFWSAVLLFQQVITIAMAVFTAFSSWMSVISIAYIAILLLFDLTRKETMLQLVINSLYVVILFLYILLATTVPKDVLMYTNSSVTYVSETRYGVSPFSHWKPMEKVPSKFGVLKTKYDLPKNWNVYISYSIRAESVFQAENLVLLKVLLREGVEIPHDLLDELGNPAKNIREYLTEKYPFMSIAVSVESHTLKKWQ